MSRARRTLSWIAIALVAGAMGYGIGRRGSESGAAGVPAEQAAPAAVTWTCSMHPQVRLPEAGQCPICFMDLVPLEEGPGVDLGPRTLRISEGAAALAEIRTAAVERRPVAHEIRMVGKVSFDETRLASLTAWVPGRLERLYVDYTGVAVRPGDHMVELYSPRLFSTQKELLEASSPAIAASARERLRRLGLTGEQIDEVVRRGTAEDTLEIRAPVGGIVIHKEALEGMWVEEGSRIYTIADLSKVWVQLEAYEQDLPWLRYGQDVTFAVEAWPGEVFHGRIAFIDPVLDDRTRTVKVRLNVENPEQRLKPEMFVRATVQAVITPHGKVVDADLAEKWMCPMHPEVIADGPADCDECGMPLAPAADLGFASAGSQELPLVIPASAPLLTGKRAVVYVRVPEAESPTFEGREVTLGPRAGDWYVVHDGLADGEEVVANGAFKLDSELQIQAKPSMMNPGAEAPDPAPAAFRRQLGELAGAYLAVSEALAGDDPETAAESAREVLVALRSVDMTLLESTAHEEWMRLSAAIEDAARSAARAQGLDPLRDAFGALTRATLAALERFGYLREGQGLGVYHCPMAFDGLGADWLQAGGEVANPYFGASMLRCGERTRDLAAGN